jgi:hypothetical protein
VASGELPPPSPRTNLVYQLSDYELRHLVSHLAEAGRDGDLHRLMRLELRESRGDDHANVENAWYAAQSRGGDFTTYAQDVERAWRLATEASLTEARSGGDAAGAGLEVRYALLAASLAARAHKIRPPLALALIQKGLWTFERGLAYARQLPRPARRVQALNGLAPLASPPQRMSLLREALAEAREVEGEVSYTLEFAPPPTTPAQAVAALAPSLPESLFDEALDIALVADELQRAEAVVELAPHLPPALLDRALAAAWALDPVVQAEPLAALAARLSGPARASLVEEGLRAWHRLDHRDEKRGRLLQLLAPHLDEANYPPAPSVPELLRFGSLPEVAVAVSLARSRSGSEGRKLLEEAEAALERKALEELDAARLKDDRDRGRLLASLAPDPRARCLAALVHRLPDAAKISTLDELVEDARGIDTDDHVGMRADVLAAAAPHMTVHQLRRAVSVAEALEDGHERAQALAAIARLLPPADRRPIFNDALAAARTRGAWALAVMLTAFGPLPQGAASVALAAAREQPDAGGRAWVLAQVVPSLTEPERTKVLAEALAEGQARTPMAVVIAFAPIAATLPHDVFVAVLDALATDSADVTFLETFTPYMPDDLLPRAHEIARAEPDVHRRAEALIALAPRSEAASNDALEAVLSRDESWWPSDLRRLAPYLPQELLEQAWQAARVSEIGRAQRLAALAPHFAEPRRRSALLEAIEAALALRPRERIEVLQELEPSFRGRGWREALALAKIPFHWGVPDRGSRINEGVERLRGARSPRDRASAARELLEFEPHLPPPLLAEALEAVCSNVEWRGEDYRVALLAQLAEPLASLARDDLGPIWSQAIHTLGTTANERGHLLAEIQALAPVLAALGGPAGLREAAGGIRDAGAWFP